MNEPKADTNRLQVSRYALASVYRIQQEGLSALDRLARYEYAVAGDYLEWTLAQCRITLGASNPADFFAQQAELGIRLSEQLHSRIRELTQVPSTGHDAVTPAPQALPVVEAAVPFARPTPVVVKKAAAAIPTLPPLAQIAASVQRGLMAADNTLVPAAVPKPLAAATAATAPTATTATTAAAITPVSIPKVFPANVQPSAPQSKARGRSTSSSRKRKSPK